MNGLMGALLNSVRNSVSTVTGFFRKSLKKRIIALILLCTLVPIACVTTISYFNSTEAMRNRILASNQKMMDWSGGYIKSTIKRLDDAVFNLAADRSFTDSLIINMDEDNAGGLQSDYNVTNKMYSLLYSNNDINSIILYARNRKKLYYVSTQTSKSFSNCNISGVAWYNGIKGGNSSLMVNRGAFPVDIGGGVAEIPENKGISIVRGIADFSSRDELFSIVLDIKWNALKDVYNLLSTDEKNEILIADAEGKAVFHATDPGFDPESLREISRQIASTDRQSGYLQYKNNYCFYYKDLPGNVTLYKIVPFSAVNKTAKENLSFGIFIGIAFLILALAMSLFVIFTTVNPIVKLSRTMKEIQQNNFEVNIDHFYEDEVGILQRSFIYMINQIKDMINREYKSKIEKNTAQLKALQAQINPHFLYNSLQMIGGIAVSKGVPEIYPSIKALSEMFRYTIKTQYDNVTFNEEIQHIKNYLNIQTLRYPGKIGIEMSIDDEILEYIIPKLCIQPLVENAFIHGFDNKLGLWKIRIAGSFENNHILFEVSDNGAGIKKEKLKEIKESLGSDDVFNSSKSLGIKNVNARLQLTFGFEYGLRVESAEGMGTSFVLKIPACRNEVEPDEKTDYSG